MLKDLFSKYIESAVDFRKTAVDLDNVQFHKSFELKIKAPVSWNAKQDVVDALTLKKVHPSKIAVVYSNTSCYKEFCTIIKDSIDEDTDNEIFFMSYYEFHYAIINSSQDIRLQQRIKDGLGAADVVVVLHSEGCPANILNAIRQFTDGVLIILD